MATAFNRREFLRHALLSLINQDADPDSFEIVVSKNFYDQRVDELCSDRGIRDVTTDSSSSGERVYDALHASHGEFVLFLDDDDIFYRTKVSRVMQVISMDGIAFYRNAIFPVTADGHVAAGYQPHMDAPLRIDRPGRSDAHRMRRLNCMFNSSSMGILRDILDDHAGDLRRIALAVDTFYFAMALSTGRPVYCDSSVESIYRIMPRSTSRDLRSFSSFVAFEKSFLHRYVPDLERINDMVRGTPAEAFMESELSIYEMLLYVFEDDECESRPPISRRLRFLRMRFPCSLMYSRTLRNLAMECEFRRDMGRIYGDVR
ncbi:glycosyltransferase family A protein [Thermoplasma sp. Kam2015]|uniref:glycosyltransferase family A protein n=1 Tax=Thermoplasma sp. Kam2015 TaxID=2094122 RepID=UPI002100CB36|nr:glycosyltransferase family 2 protein [Thermoplasma sp. Kam2015]